MSFLAYANHRGGDHAHGARGRAACCWGGAGRSSAASRRGSVSFVAGAQRAVHRRAGVLRGVSPGRSARTSRAARTPSANALIDAYAQAGATAEPTRAPPRACCGTTPARLPTGSGTRCAFKGRPTRSSPTSSANCGPCSPRCRPGDPGSQLAREQSLRDVRRSTRATGPGGLATGNKVFNRVLLGGTVVGAALMVAFPMLRAQPPPGERHGDRRPGGLTGRGRLPRAAAGAPAGRPLRRRPGLLPRSTQPDDPGHLTPPPDQPPAGTADPTHFEQER